MQYRCSSEQKNKYRNNLSKTSFITYLILILLSVSEFQMNFLIDGVSFNLTLTSYEKANQKAELILGTPADGKFQANVNINKIAWSTQPHQLGGIPKWAVNWATRRGVPVNVFTT